MKFRLGISKHCPLCCLGEIEQSLERRGSNVHYLALSFRLFCAAAKYKNFDDMPVNFVSFFLTNRRFLGFKTEHTKDSLSSKPENPD